MKEEDTQSQLQYSDRQSSDLATAKLMGGIGKMADGTKVRSRVFSTPLKISELFDLLSKEIGLELRRDSTLVLVNGVEANAIEDLNTIIRGGDSIVLIPMFHGG